MLFYLFYIVIPCSLIESINILEKWYFSESVITNTRLIIISVSLLLLILFTFFDVRIQKNTFMVNERYKIVYRIFSILVFFTSALCVYGIFKLILEIRISGYINSYFLLREQKSILEKQLGLKKLIYMLLPAVLYSYMYTKRKKYFITFILLIIFDVIGGTRTNSFICILFIYLVAVNINKKIYFFPMLLILIVLCSGVLLTRAKAVTGDQKTGITISIIGAEFTNTFITTPYVLSKNLLGEGLSLERQMSQMIQGFLPGTIQTALNSLTLGEELASHIGRGYGLGLNFITELLYLYGYAGLILIPIYFILLYFIDTRLSNNSQFIIRFIFIFQSRLFIREGIIPIEVALYIIGMYILIPYLFSKKNNYMKLIFNVKQKIA
jgi:hypothetical protein